jgi:Putative beta-barrel porin-2, OmpL-like. bbp2
LDVGILGSPYTNEGAISKDHLMYTRSFGTQFVPYYLSGAKVTVPISKKINLFLYLINGWQVINDNNNGKSVATQVEYRPNKKMLFNWNTYVGSEQSAKNPTFRTRYFSEFFWIVKTSAKFDATACAYLGIQDVAHAPARLWQSVSLIGRYHFTEKISLSGRIEYFNDPESVQQAPITGLEGFRSASSGLCLNVKIDNNALFRVEGRQFFSPDNVYVDEKLNPVQSSTLLAASLTAWF